jgi:AmmeMemoRadiSam system protein A
VYSPDERRLLRALARQSIEHGLDQGRSLQPEPDGYPQRLREWRASFVTLEYRGRLRGCIGTLEAWQALVCDVADHAYGAAFKDPRFPPLSPLEAADIELHISVLTPPETLACTSESRLLEQLHPGVDGLILHEHSRRATFLPAVWDDLPDPRDFLTHLKRKAGLSPNYWSSELRFERYRAESL